MRLSSKENFKAVNILNARISCERSPLAIITTIWSQAILAQPQKLVCKHVLGIFTTYTVTRIGITKSLWILRLVSSSRSIV